QRRLLDELASTRRRIKELQATLRRERRATRNLAARATATRAELGALRDFLRGATVRDLQVARSALMLSAEVLENAGYPLLANDMSSEAGLCRRAIDAVRKQIGNHPEAVSDDDIPI